MKTSLYFLFIIIFNNGLFAQISDFKSVDFTKADRIAKLNKGASLENLPLLTQQLTSTLQTDVEKFRAIYSWVCHNIEGDDAQHSKVTSKRKKFKNDSTALLKWNANFKKIAFKKLLKHKKTMCTGYAYLVKELCFLANIDCVIIDGYGRDVEANVNQLERANHSWNAVKLNNKWYLCDATWSSGYMDYRGNFIKDYNDGYFLTLPVLFGKNHFPLQLQWTLNSSVTASTFINAPLVYGETFKHNISPITPKNMNLSVKKNDDVTFSFKSPKSASEKKVSLVYYIGAREILLQINSIENNDNITSFHYNFKQRGHYDVHIKVNSDVVATYTVNVTKM
jgi:transglutaminase/protease-like cytokinesis protein 3